MPRTITTMAFRFCNTISLKRKKGYAPRVDVVDLCARYYPLLLICWHYIWTLILEFKPVIFKRMTLQTIDSAKEVDDEQVGQVLGKIEIKGLFVNWGWRQSNWLVCVFLGKGGVLFLASQSKAKLPPNLNFTLFSSKMRDMLRNDTFWIKAVTRHSPEMKKGYFY